MLSINCSVRTRSYAGIPMSAELNNRRYSNTITSVQKDNLILEVYEVSEIRNPKSEVSNNS